MGRAGARPGARHPQVREELADHHGIVQRGDQAQPIPTMGARQDINGIGRHILTAGGSEVTLPRKRPARELDQAAW